MTTILNVNGWLLTVPHYSGPSYAHRKAIRMNERREYLRQRWLFATQQSEKYSNLARLRYEQSNHASATFYQTQAAAWHKTATEHWQEWIDAVPRYGA